MAAPEMYKEHLLILVTEFYWKTQEVGKLQIGQHLFKNMENFLVNLTKLGCERLDALYICK